MTPSASNQTLNTGLYRSVTVNGDADLVAGNIKNAIDIFGVTGTMNAETHSNCTGNAQQGCVTTATYQSADLTNLTAGNIKNGVTIAGTAGNYPSATSPLTGNTATTDLPSLASTVAAGSYEWFTSDGTRLTGSVTDAFVITPTAASQNFTASVYRMFTVVGDADLVAGNIKSGVSIFGVAGGYPSATYPLSGADTTADLDLATFDAKVKSSTAFEWFTPNGVRQTYNGDADIAASNILSGVSIFGTTGSVVVPSNCAADGVTGCVTTSQYKSVDTNAYTAWDVRKGKTMGGVAGSLKFCTNGSTLTVFNNNNSPATSALDLWDSIDDFNNGNTGIPTQNGLSSVGGELCSSANWQDLTADGACSSSTDFCMYKDLISNLTWTETIGSANWYNGIINCNNSTSGGYSDWRMPTEKELMQAAVDGIRSVESSSFGDIDVNLWSATTKSDFANDAWIVNMGTGEIGHAGTATIAYRCVRP